MSFAQIPKMFEELTRMGILAAMVMSQSIAVELMGIVPKVADLNMVARNNQLSV